MLPTMPGTVSARDKLSKRVGVHDSSGCRSGPQAHGSATKTGSTSSLENELHECRAVLLHRSAVRYHLLSTAKSVLHDVQLEALSQNGLSLQPHHAHTGGKSQKRYGIRPRSTRSPRPPSSPSRRRRYDEGEHRPACERPRRRGSNGEAAKRARMM